MEMKKYGMVTASIRALLAEDLNKTWTFSQIEEILGPCNASGILGTLALRKEVEVVGRISHGRARTNIYKPTKLFKSVGRNPSNETLPLERKEISLPILSGKGIKGVTVYKCCDY
jgi:hypothetical protein